MQQDKRLTSGIEYPGETETMIDQHQTRQQCHLLLRCVVKTMAEGLIYIWGFMCSGRIVAYKLEAQRVEAGIENEK